MDAPTYVLCVKNRGYRASLQVGKFYRTLPRQKKEHLLNDIRVIDESGEDYLFPRDFFAAIPLPREAVRAIARAQRAADAKWRATQRLLAPVARRRRPAL